MKSKIEFRVFVHHEFSPQYFLVKIWPNKETLNSDRWMGRKKTHDCEAYFSPNNKGSLTVKCDCGGTHKRNLPLMGTLHFHSGCLNYGIIAHESFHAVMSWAVDSGANPAISESCDPDSNEICAGILGRMVANIIAGILASKLKIVNL